MTSNERLGDPMGRLHIPDVRDRMFRIAPTVRSREAGEAVERGWRYWWQDGWWGDQWFTPQCVAYAWLHWLEDGPSTRRPRQPGRTAQHGQGAALLNPQNVYDEAQRIDYWPGEDYDGTSVRAGAKVLRSHGFIKEFRWAWDVDTLSEALLTEGPIVVGTNWYDSMMETGDKGMISVVTSGQVYGHAYLVNGVNTSKEVFRIKNSWGRQWGEGGTAYISFGDMATLFNENGEACLAVEAE